jgi:hypothetical protein
MTIKSLIQQIASGDAVSAKQSLEDILSTKSLEALELKKQEISKNLFNNGFSDDSQESEMETQEQE